MTSNEASGDAVVGVSNEQQPKFPWRAGVGLLLGGAGWFWGFQALNAVLLPAKIQMIDPVNKVTIVAMVSTVTMIISLVAGIVGGALSDRTRSRFGARTPWIVGGMAVGTVLLILFITFENLIAVLVVWWLYSAVYNAMLAAGCAWQPDQVAPRWRGTASSMYGMGHQAALLGAQVIAAQFVTNITMGVLISLVIFDVLSLAAVLVNQEKSNKNMPRHHAAGSLFEGFKDFLPPSHAGRDYWLAALARFLWMMPGGIGTYRLYTLTDYMSQPAKEAGQWMSLMSTIGLIAAVSFCAVAGPISDKVHSVKIPLAVAIFTVGLPCWLPFFVPTPVAYTVYVGVSSIGSGIFSALDQTIMTSVLPDPRTQAKDLAFLNSCGVLGNLGAPLLAGAVVSAFGYAGLFPMGFIVLTMASVCVFCIKTIK